MTGLVPSGQITRRSLLAAGAGAAATAAIPDIALAAKKKRKRSKRRSYLDRSTWESLLGTVLDVRDRGATPVAVSLVTVGDMPGGEKQSDRFRERTFYLVFKGPTDSPLAADTHLIKLPGVGKVPVWFSSARLTDQGWEYVAVFANSRRRQRPPRKPRAKGSRRQGRRRGRKRRR